MRIAVLGKGFIGSKLVDHLSKNHEVTNIRKDNYLSCKGMEFDVFINANGNSKRFLAEQAPKWDFEANCVSTFNTLLDFKFKKYIHLSTLDVYKGSVYGNNKAIAEWILFEYQEKYNYSLNILRMSMLVDKTKELGVVADIQKEKVLGVSKDSQFQIFNISGLITWVDILLKNQRHQLILDLAGYPAMTMSKIENVLGKKGIYKENSPTHYYNYAMEGTKLFGPVKTSEEYLRESLE